MIDPELFCVDAAVVEMKPKIIAPVRLLLFYYRPKLLQFFDMRRANNICIGLSRFHRSGLTNIGLIAAVEEMDSLKLSSDDLLTLIGLQPTIDEMKLAGEHNKKGFSLQPGPAEEFAIELLSHPFFSKQLLAFLFTLQYPIEVEESIIKLDKLSAVSALLKSHLGFKTLLKIVLEIGNMTNNGAAGGQGKALGFKVDGLARLAEVKSADGKWNLMTFLVDMIAKQAPELLDIASYFEDVSLVRHYDIAAISNILKNMGTTIKQLHKIEYGQLFHDKFLLILEDASIQLFTCTRKFDEFVVAWRDALQYFGEDLEDYSTPSLQMNSKDTAKRPPGYIYRSLDSFLQSYKSNVASLRSLSLEKEANAARLRKLEEAKIDSDNANANAIAEKQMDSKVDSYAERLAQSKIEQEMEFQQAALMHKKELELEKGTVETYAQKLEKSKVEQETQFKEAARMFKRLSQFSPQLAEPSDIASPDGAFK